MTHFCVYNIEEYEEEGILACMQQYLLDHHEPTIMTIMDDYDNAQPFPVEISALDLLEWHAELGSLLLAHPKKLLPLFDQAVVDVQSTIFAKNNAVGTSMSIKKDVHVRVKDIPRTPDLFKQSVAQLRNSDAGKLIALSGTVIRTGPVKMLERFRQLSCKKCKHRFAVYSDLEQFNQMVVPSTCPNPLGTCKGTAMQFEEAPKSSAADMTSGFKNYQELKIQDNASQLDVGSMPRSITIICEDELADMVKAGDDLLLTGVLIRRWRPIRADFRPLLELAIHVNHITINNEKKQSSAETTQEERNWFSSFWSHFNDTEQILRGRDTIIKSFCPQIYGMYLVKLALLLSVIGGVSKVSDSGTRTRAESHLLLVGDPGLGKSQLLKFAAKVSARHVLTTGIGTTNAGLTAMASKDASGDWTLEAGALVLADGGVCCIDEFDQIQERDRVSVHEAMEQQTLSMAKAGLVCTLNTRTTVIAACNPKGNYDTTIDLSVNTNLASPLLSRFDIVLVLVDMKDKDWDDKVSAFILNDAASGGSSFAAGAASQQLHPFEQTWKLDKLKSYIAYVKTIKPKLTPDAQIILGNYYRAQRKPEERNVARTTMRLLESLIRLSEAHARLLMKDTVDVIDAVFAIMIIDSSVNTEHLFVKPGNVHKDFPLDPEEDANTILCHVISRYGSEEQKKNMLSQLQVPNPWGEEENQVVVPVVPSQPRNRNFAAQSPAAVTKPKQPSFATPSPATPQAKKPRVMVKDDDDDDDEDMQDASVAIGVPEPSTPSLVRASAAPSPAISVPFRNSQDSQEGNERIVTQRSQMPPPRPVFAQPPKLRSPPMQSPVASPYVGSASPAMPSASPLTGIQQTLQAPVAQTRPPTARLGPKPVGPLRPPVAPNQPITRPSPAFCQQVVAQPTVDSGRESPAPFFQVLQSQTPTPSQQSLPTSSQTSVQQAPPPSQSQQQDDLTEDDIMNF